MRLDCVGPWKSLERLTFLHTKMYTNLNYTAQWILTNEESCVTISQIKKLASHSRKFSVPLSIQFPQTWQPILWFLSLWLVLLYSWTLHRCSHLAGTFCCLTSLAQHKMRGISMIYISSSLSIPAELYRYGVVCLLISLRVVSNLKLPTFKFTSLSFMSF